MKLLREPFLKRRSYSFLLSVLLVLSLVSIHPPVGHAYVGALGNVISSSVSGDTLTLTVDNGAEPNNDILEIKVLTSSIAKFDYRPNGVAVSSDTPIIDPNKTWSAVGATINTASNPITITTTQMKIEIAKTPTRVTVKKADNTVLLYEPATGGINSDSVKFLHNTSHNMYGIRGYNFTESGGDLLRNDSTHPAHAGEQGDAGGPFIWSTSGYGVLVDSDGGYPVTESATGKLEFYYGGTPTEGRRYAKQDMEYYVMLGSPKEIMGSYAAITGKTPMLPKWSLGFSNFEWGTNQTELLSNIDTYRAKNIPLDSVGLDYDWKKYGSDNYGEFTWNTTNFPSASTTALKTTMDSKGVKMIGITKPRIVTEDTPGHKTVQHNDADAGGYWYPGHGEYQDYFIPVKVRSIDPYNANERTWYWDHSKAAFDKGIVGWWNDETDKVSSNGVELWFGNYTTTHFSQAMYEGQRAYAPNTRVWQTARTYYPGAHRYATTLWSGDVGIQWHKNDKLDWANGMIEQRQIMLSAINMGQTKWGMDVGGFNPNSFNPSPELYSRWMQFSAFTPVFRAHGNLNQQRQPWLYGNSAEESAKSAIQLRYSLLPYMYAYERSAYETGVGLIRPLLYDYPTDSTASNYLDAWMFGDWLLTAPIVNKQQTLKSIYLPAGTWIDYFRGTTYSGGQTISYPVNPNTWSDIPVFVKKGGIIPTQKVLDHTGQSTISTIGVDVFPDATQSIFNYYDDDGASYSYEGTGYFKQTLTAKDNGGSGIAFGVGAKSGTYSAPVTSYLAAIHGKAGTGVTINGSAATSFATLNQLKAAAGEGWAIGKDVYGPVTYVKVAAGSSSARNVVISGSAAVSNTTIQYEAEDASLSGSTTTTKASVNTNHTGFEGSGFVDGLGNTGAGVTFYPNVTAGGDYAIDLRYANASGAAKTMSIYVNGRRVKQTSLANLASWNTWATKSETIPLEAGRNSVTYKYELEAGDTGNVNLDFIKVPLAATAAKYEAEAAKLSGGAVNNQNHWFYSGSAFVEGLTAVNAQAEFQVTVPSAGSYTLALRYANGTNATKTLTSYVNGTSTGTISMTSPGVNWNIWNEVTKTVTLNAGMNTVAFMYAAGNSGNVNLDRLLVSSTTPGTPESEQNLLDNPDFDRDLAHNSNWTEWHPGGQALAYGVDSGSSTNPPESPWTQDKRAYFWLSTAYEQSIHQVISVPVNNTNYKFEAWVRMKNTTPTAARAEISNYGGAMLTANITNTDGWRRISIDNIFVTNGQIDVGFYVNSPGGTSLHIDDVRLTKQ